MTTRKKNPVQEAIDRTDWKAAFHEADATHRKAVDELDRMAATLAEVRKHRDENAGNGHKWRELAERQERELANLRADLSRMERRSAYWQGVAFGLNPNSADKAREALDNNGPVSVFEDLARHRTRA